MPRDNPIRELKVTNAKVRVRPGFGYYSRNQHTTHLALTGTFPNGERAWVQFPPSVGLTQAGAPLAGVGDTVFFTARKKGESEDGNIGFYNYARLISIIDAPETQDEIDAALDEYAAKAA